MERAEDIEIKFSPAKNRNDPDKRQICGRNIAMIVKAL